MQSTLQRVGRRIMDDCRAEPFVPSAGKSASGWRFYNCSRREGGANHGTPLHQDEQRIGVNFSRNISKVIFFLVFIHPLASNGDTPSSDLRAHSN